MSIKTAEQIIIDAINVDIRCLDKASNMNLNGAFMVFTELHPISDVEAHYDFVLFLNRKILDKRFETIYKDLDAVRIGIRSAVRNLPEGDTVKLVSIKSNGVEDGVLEYACFIQVVEMEKGDY